MNVAIDGMLLRGRYSGVEVYIAEMTAALVARGRNAYRLYLPRGSESPVGPGRALSLRPVRVPFGARLARILWEQTRLAGEARRAGADVLYAAGYIAPSRAPLPVVASIHDVLALTHPEWCKAVNRLHYRLTLPATIRSASRIVVPSEHTRAEIVRLFPSAAGRIRRIPPGVRRALGAEQSGEDQPMLNLPSRYILFTGNIEPKKNLVALVRAFHALKTTGAIPHALVIAGRRGWKCGAVFHEVRALGLTHEVRFPGYVAPHALKALYAGADVFAFPSIEEGFGMPVIEAMSCGTPAVVSDGGALPEVAGDAALVAPAGDFRALAAAIHRVIREPGLALEMAARGRRRAAEFSWDRAAAEMERMFEEAAGGGQ